MTNSGNNYIFLARIKVLQEEIEKEALQLLIKTEDIIPNLIQTYFTNIRLFIN